MNGGSNLKSELQLTTDMFRRQPSTQSVADHSITVDREYTRNSLYKGVEARNNNVQPISDRKSLGFHNFL